MLEKDPCALSIQIADSQKATLALAEVARAGIGFSDYSLGQPSLDEVFFALTGRTTDAEEAAEKLNAQTGATAVDANKEGVSA
jgi:ABC-2 type transport system ATP-binding protein